MRGIIKRLFERDYSLAQCAVASAVTVALFRRHYALAALIFIAGIVLCCVGEIKMERR